MLVWTTQHATCFVSDASMWSLHVTSHVSASPSDVIRSMTAIVPFVEDSCVEADNLPEKLSPYKSQNQNFPIQLNSKASWTPNASEIYNTYTDTFLRADIVSVGFQASEQSDVIAGAMEQQGGKSFPLQNARKHFPHLSVWIHLLTPRYHWEKNPLSRFDPDHTTKMIRIIRSTFWARQNKTEGIK